MNYSQTYYFVSTIQLQVTFTDSERVAGSEDWLEILGARNDGKLEQFER
jgi:hypothetical protein